MATIKSESKVDIKLYVIIAVIIILFYFILSLSRTSDNNFNAEMINEPHQLHLRMQAKYVDGFCKRWHKAQDIRNTENRRFKKQLLIEEFINTQNSIRFFLQDNDLPTEWLPELANYVAEQREKCGFDYQDN